MKYKCSLIIWMVWFGCAMVLAPMALANGTTNILIIVLVIEAILATMVTLVDIFVKE